MTVKKNNKDSKAINIVKESNEFVRKIDKEFRDTLKNSNILIFKSLSKTITIAHVFMNYKDFCRLLGPNIAELEIAMNHAISKIFTNACYDAIINSNLILSGVYTKEGIYSMFANGYLKYCHDKNGRYYFTYQGGEKYIHSKESVAAAHVIPYDEYTNVRFYATFTIIQGALLKLIINHSASLPKLLQTDQNETQNIMMFRLFHEAMNYSFMKFFNSDWAKEKKLNDITQLKEASASETLINMFFGYIESDMLVFFANILKETGLSMIVINRAISNSDIHLLYGNRDSTVMKDVTFHYAFIQKTVSRKDKNLSVTFNTSFNDLVSMMYYDPKSMTKKQKNEYGKNIYEFINELITYVMNIDTKYAKNLL